MNESDGSGCQKPFSIGTSVRNRIAHLMQSVEFRRAVSVGVQNACNSTHTETCSNQTSDSPKSRPELLRRYGICCVCHLQCQFQDWFQRAKVRAADEKT